MKQFYKELILITTSKCRELKNSRRNKIHPLPWSTVVTNAREIYLNYAIFKNIDLKKVEPVGRPIDERRLLIVHDKIINLKSHFDYVDQNMNPLIQERAKRVLVEVHFNRIFSGLEIINNLFTITVQEKWSFNVKLESDHFILTYKDALKQTSLKINYFIDFDLAIENMCWICRWGLIEKNSVVANFKSNVLEEM